MPTAFLPATPQGLHDQGIRRFHVRGPQPEQAITLHPHRVLTGRRHGIEVPQQHDCLASRIEWSRRDAQTVSRAHQLVRIETAAPGLDVIGDMYLITSLAGDSQ